MGGGAGVAYPRRMGWPPEEDLRASAMCHKNVTHMGRTTIRELKHQTSAVLERVAAGEIVEVWRRKEIVAILSPPATAEQIEKPDFTARRRATFGDRKMKTTGTDLISGERGDR